MPTRRDKDELAFVVLCLLRVKGLTAAQIAAEVGITVRWTRELINLARRNELLGRCPNPREFGLRLECRCDTDPIPTGEKIVCVKCCACGWDFHPDMHARPLPKDPPKKYEPAPGLKGGV